MLGLRTAFAFRKGSKHVHKFNEALYKVFGGIDRMKQVYKLPHVKVNVVTWNIKMK
jgi:hypothetical protein